VNAPPPLTRARQAITGIGRHQRPILFVPESKNGLTGGSVPVLNTAHSQQRAVGVQGNGVGARGGPWSSRTDNLVPSGAVANTSGPYAGSSQPVVTRSTACFITALLDCSTLNGGLVLVSSPVDSPANAKTPISKDNGPVPSAADSVGVFPIGNPTGERHLQGYWKCGPNPRRGTWLRVPDHLLSTLKPGESGCGGQAVVSSAAKLQKQRESRMLTKVGFKFEKQPGISPLTADP